MKKPKCTHCPYYVYDDDDEAECLGCVGNRCEYAGDKCPTGCYEPLDGEEDKTGVKC